jgi:enoyl-CoA hydratase/carnithine racemase
VADRARFEVDGDVGILTIDDPPLNLFGAELTQAVRACVDEARSASPRALLVRAEGDVFTGGADVNVFHGLTPEQAEEFAGDLLAITHGLEDLPFPTICAVHGLCLTAGFELALACDMIWAAESAQFGLVEIVVGVTPFMGGTQRVAERAGPARARELVMSGGLYPAATLERWNVVNRVLPDDGFDPAARAFARALAEGPTRAHAATKALVRAQVEGGARAADALVPEVAGALFATEDLKDAVRSFLEDGPGRARFSGR